MDEVQLERQLADIFFIESGEMLSEAALSLLRGEEINNLQDVIHQVFRAIHSIKGGAQSLGFEQLSEVAHYMEDFLVPLQRGTYTIDRQTVSLLLEAMDGIEMQLNACQAGEPPIDCSELLKKLAEVTVVTEECAETRVAPTTFGCRLLYLSFTVAPTASMPGITAFIFLEQLRKTGRLLYSQPDIDDLSMAVSGEYLTQTAVIQTDLSNDDVEEVAYGVSDIYDIKIGEINNKVFLKVDKPTKEEITAFNSLVGKMRDMLCCKNRDEAYLDKLAREIIDWGEDSRGAAVWFPGGLPVWRRMTSLLSDTVAALNVAQSNCEGIGHRALQLLWEMVYNALCNHTYFYSVPIGDILAGDGLSVIQQLEASGVDVQIVTIDLSLLKTLEGEHLKALADFRDELGKQGWILWLISEGEHTRRHLNVLEISEQLIGALGFYSNSYSAVLDTEKNEIVVRK